ncbi:MAG TPA: signal peptidase I [Verrucomicrobiae bacterium]|jgi:signal peptidase I
MKLRWFLSGTVRQATDMCKHVEKLLNAQRDILPNSALVAVTPVVADTRESIRLGADDATLRQKMEELEGIVAKWIKPYPNAEWRENIEVFLVAIVVAMAIRTFFLQPFKIPTGSMQPTLFGITEKDLRADRDFKMPNMLQRIYEAAVHGVIYHQIIAPDGGQVDLFKIGPVQHVLLMINKQTFWVKYDHQSELTPITLWFGPDEHLAYYAGLDKRSVFSKGDPIVCFEEKTGDHLFVDRFTYNFRTPNRGDIVVFKTKGIDGIAQDQFYIKRLVGLPGETVSIGDDRHARINGVPLDASTPHFENVYGFDPSKPPQESHYSGHVLDSRSLIATPEDSLKIPERSYVVFGDNTMNSLDSRFWRFVPQNNVIGKAFFIYWPISDRFGWGQH